MQFFPNETPGVNKLLTQLISYLSIISYWPVFSGFKENDMKINKLFVLSISLSLLLMAACTTLQVQTQTSETVGMGSTQAMTEMPTMEAQAASTSDTMANNGNAAKSDITIQNFAFDPAALTVKVGTTVTWTNQDSVQHSATSDNGIFDSGLLSKGQSFSYTFSQAGEYTYHCSIHPKMVGSITVTQ